MNTIFMNSKNSLTSDPRRLLLSLTNKLNLKRSAKHVALSNLSIYYTWKNVKCHTKMTNLKYQLQHWLRNLNYLMDHYIYQIFKNIINISQQKHGEKSDNLSMIKYVKEIENRVTCGTFNT